MKVFNLKAYRWIYVTVPIVLFITLLAFPVFMSARHGENNLAAGVGADSDSAASGSVSASSKYAWGLKRGKNGSLPEVGSSEAKLLEKYDGCYLGDTTKKTIYLTFDEGYENGYSEQILDTLKKTGVKAAFFITGDYYERSNDIVARMVSDGHEVGNHTEGHYSLPSISSEKIASELSVLDDKFFEQFGKHMRLMRPPMGEFDDKSLAVAKELGYTCMMWSFAYKDWIADKPNGADYAHKMVMENLHNGEIILLHAVSSDNAEALERIITDARAQGYTFGDPAELIATGGLQDNAEKSGATDKNSKG